MNTHKKYIVGNWKANKTSDEVNAWWNQIASYVEKNPRAAQNIHLVICPPFVYLPLSKSLRDRMNLPIQLGAQNVSPFPSGAYTGEISAVQVREFATYVLIGHSERRTQFHESETDVNRKTTQAQKAGLTTIICVPDETTPIPPEAQIVAYEPIFAIGSNTPDDPKRANSIAEAIKRKRQQSTAVLYGGSVTPENISGFLSEPNIDGVLPGKASLDPDVLWQLIRHAETQNAKISP